MLKNKWILPALLLLVTQSSTAQTTITRWNFNSNPPDASNSTGSSAASTGAGTLTTVGGTTTLFASGVAGTGSSDPAATDNTGMGVTSWPGSGTGNKTAGLQFAASTAGYTNIQVSFDARPSNTSPRHYVLQYTLDVSAGSPVWVDFTADSFQAGDAWSNNRIYNLSSVSALNNNPNAGFRLLSSFSPSAGNYVAATTGSLYATTGNWRMDMLTISGTTAGADVTPPVAQNLTVQSSTTSFIRFSEAVSAATATDLNNYGFSPSLAVTSATLSNGGDTLFLTHDPLVDGQPYTLNVANIQDMAGNTMAGTGFNVLYNTSIPNLVITEIIHSPNDVESIEVYNAGTGPVNLGGLKWTDGTTGNFPQVTLAAGATVVFATAPGTASASLNTTPVYLINNGLGGSNDVLVIRNSLNQVIDSVDYYVGTNGWPIAPVGVYAYSFELNNPANNNNLGSNWSVPANTVTPQPAVGVIRSTMGAYPPPAPPVTNGSVSFAGTRLNVGENGTEVRIVATMQGGGPGAASIDLEVIPFGTALSGSDFTVPASMQYNWAPNANNVNDTIVIAINDDALPEDAEYFIVRLTNPVNIDTPAAGGNHFTVFIMDNDKQAPEATQAITLNHIASIGNGTAGSNSAEIVAYDASSQKLFIANSIGGKIDIINFSNPAAPVLVNSISMAPYGGINSIAVRNGIVAAAIENSVPENSGKIVFFDANGVFLSQVNAGAMPDMITFNKAGTKVLTADEGQPKSDYTVDPNGSVTIVDISGGAAGVTQSNVTTIDFTSFNGQAASLEAAGVRIFGPGSTVAQDMEPEYLTVSDDDQTAWVTCQENNAFAVIDLTTNTVTQILPLGTKDFNAPGNAIDANDQGGVVQIANWPVHGVYMPDAVASYKVGGTTYLITANEGDAREYDALTEIVRLGSSSYVLDPVAFPYAAAVKANLGRLNVTTASGDTDGDGDFDEIHTFGGRSVSIWNAATGALVWDSGDDMELIISKHPTLAALFNASNANNTLKNRSDDKGPEPEGVATATINGRTYAFIALERIGGCMVYDVTDPNNPVFVDYKNTRNIASYGGDQGSEGIIYIPGNESPNGKAHVILANEVSSTLSIFELEGNTTVQILHASDFEAGISAIDDAPNFAAIIDTLESAYPNSLTLASGDNYIPSPFSNSSEDAALVTPLKNAYINYYGSSFANNDLRAGIGRVDITIMNILGVEASALGNHEFDLGTSEVRNIIAGVNSGSAIRWFGAQFPYLSANLDFSADVNLSNLFEPARKPNTFFKSNPAQTAAQIAATKKLSKSTIIHKNGQSYGIVGATTPTLASISSTGATTVINPGAGTNDMALLASIIQPVVDSLRFADGLNKIILLTHLQQLHLEQELATHLHGVDVIIGGGSHSLLADSTDRLRDDDSAQGVYPILATGADGKAIAIVNTTGEYRYVGRLVLDFDINGDIIPSSINAAISGAYATDTQGVEDLYGSYAAAFTPGSKGQQVRELTNAIKNVIVAKDGNLFGKTAVYLEGRRNFVRTEETNLGNLSADANLWQARQVDSAVTISIKNGGGIRSHMGTIEAVGSEVTYGPTAANPAAGKAQGDISQLDIENALRFNNRLSILTLTATGVKAILEHGVAASTPGATPGQFPQVGGIEFAFNPAAPANSRILTAVVKLGTGEDTLVKNGAVYGDPSRTFKVVTLNFLAGGGDGYPFNTLGSNRRDIDTVSTLTAGSATFTVPGSEQDAFAEYMLAFHSVTPYAQRDTTIAGDQRIQNVSGRGDCILYAVGIAPSENLTICPTGNAILTADAGDSYLWSTGATTQSITIDQAGSYYVSVINAAGCSDTSAPVTVDVRTIPAVKILNLAPLSVCEGNSVAFMLDTAADYAGFTYQWRKNNIDIAGAVGSSYTAAESGNYSITVSGGTGCSKSSAGKTVNVKASPTASFIAGGATSFCEGGNVILYADTLAGYKFTWLNNGIAAGAGPAKKAQVSGDYSVVASLNGCTDTSAMQTITVFPSPAAAIMTQDPLTFCSGDSAVLDAAPSGAGYSYQWQIGTSPLTGETSGSLAAITNGTYLVRVTDAQGCSKLSAAVKIKTETSPTASITALGSTTIATGGQVKLRAVSSSAGSGVTYLWFKDGNSISGAVSRDLIVTEGGDYTVVITRGNCSTPSAVTTVTETGVKESAGATASLGQEELSFEFSAYPNPVNATLTISLRGMADVNGNIRIMDMNGRIVASTEMKQTSLTLDMSSYVPGVYLIRYKDEAGRSATLKITKE